MNFSEEELILYFILTLILLENTWELYLSCRQVKTYTKSRTVPKELHGTMKQSTFDKAREYGLDRQTFEIFKGILMDVIVLSLELWFGAIAYFWHKAIELTEMLGFDVSSEIIVSCVFLLVLSGVSIIKDTPFKVYSTFVVEERHGFNKQTVGFFIKDQIKSFVLNIVLTLPIASAVIYIVQVGGQYFFVWLWAFVSVVMLLLMTIYPIVIAPLFDKYRPLDNGSLRTSIENLAASLKFPLTQLYVVEGSKRSAHSNAYFYGFWGSKRIVLFDTLLINKGRPIERTTDASAPEGTDATENLTDNDHAGKGCSDSEVLAVLAHELGHWKLGHMVKNIVIGQIHLFLMFAAFAQLFHYEPLYRAIGFYPNERPILVGLLLISSYILAAYNALISFGMTVLSRKFEYEADAFAKQLGYTKELCTALIKLNTDNLGFPIHDWLYSMWNHSHPTLMQRIDRLNDKKTN